MVGMRIVVRIVQLQYLAFFLLLFCTMVAGEKNGVLWFMFIAEVILGLFVARVVIEHRRRRRANAVAEEYLREEHVRAPTPCANRSRFARHGHHGARGLI